MPVDKGDRKGIFRVHEEKVLFKGERVFAEGWGRYASPRQSRLRKGWKPYWDERSLSARDKKSTPVSDRCRKRSEKAFFVLNPGYNLRKI
jgi:hypothetical protein